MDRCMDTWMDGYMDGSMGAWMDVSLPDQIEKILLKG
jgi:hypothetical protein